MNEKEMGINTNREKETEKKNILKKENRIS